MLSEPPGKPEKGKKHKNTQLKIVYMRHRIKTKLLGDVSNVTELENESFNTVDPWQYRSELPSPLTLIHRLFFNGKHYSAAVGWNFKWIQRAA